MLLEYKYDITSQVHRFKSETSMHWFTCSHCGFMRTNLSELCATLLFWTSLQSFTLKPDEVKIEEDPLLNDGFMNYLVRLRAGDGNTVIAKYAPPYMKVRLCAVLFWFITTN